MNRRLCCLCVIFAQFGSCLMWWMSASINLEDVRKANLKSKHLEGTVGFSVCESFSVCAIEKRPALLLYHFWLSTLSDDFILSSCVETKVSLNSLPGNFSTLSSSVSSSLPVFQGSSGRSWRRRSGMSAASGTSSPPCLSSSAWTSSGSGASRRRVCFGSLDKPTWSKSCRTPSTAAKSPLLTGMDRQNVK